MNDRLKLDVRLQETRDGKVWVTISMGGKTVAQEEFVAAPKALAFLEDYARTMREAVEQELIAQLLKRGKGAREYGLA